MKVKKIIVPAVWMVRGHYEYWVPAEMSEEEATKAAIEMAEEDPLPKVDCEYIGDSFEVDEEGIKICEPVQYGSGFKPDFSWKENSIVEMTCKVETNRRVRDNESFGAGESFLIAGVDEYNFDFVHYEGERKDNNVIDIRFSELDTEVFPNSNLITPEIMKNSSFKEVSFDMDGCGKDLKILRVFDVRVSFQDGTVVEFDELPRFCWGEEEAS